jgi:antitoxin (DNA-binding transcriptional repressor) of toxin-antitoxin stability system
MYNVHMNMSATEFRKNLFGVLERVIAGETVDIVYKGSSVRVAAGGTSTKLSRAKRRPTLLCDPDAIVHSDPNVLKKMEAGWAKDWKKL